MKRNFCGKCNGILPKGDSTCDRCGHFNEALYPDIETCRRCRKVIVALSVLLGLVIVVIICNSAMLFPWQKEARKNKQAALEYINANYSDAKFIEAHYGTTKINFENNGYDQFVFDLNGIRFSIFAERGKITIDSYWSAFAEHQLYDTYIKPFIESRNITTKFSYSANELQNFFKNNPEANISQFDGGVGFVIYDDECTNPKSLGWLYDFYCYCKESIPFTRYTVTVICLESSLTFSNESEFENEDAFYNSFS